VYGGGRKGKGQTLIREFPIGTTNAEGTVLKRAERLETVTHGDTTRVVCSKCFRESKRNTKAEHFFDHYSSDPNVVAGEFRLRGAAPSYELLMRAHAHTAQSEWIPAGAGIVRCRACETTYSLVTGEQSDL